jgi:hypothetical protein
MNAYRVRSDASGALIDGASWSASEVVVVERGKRPLASMRFDKWIVVPKRYQVPMKKPCCAG